MIRIVQILILAFDNCFIANAMRAQSTFSMNFWFRGMGARKLSVILYKNGETVYTSWFCQVKTVVHCKSTHYVDHWCNFCMEKGL